MAIELKFHKTNGAPWGFRLIGGADCDVPLTVLKVYEDSIAENGGLQVDDVIVRINDHTTAGLTHIEIHDVILEAEQELDLGIRRGYYHDGFTDDEESNEEICNIVNGLHQENSNLNLANDTEQQQIQRTSNASITDEQIAAAISGEAEVLPDQNVLGVNFNKIDLSESTVLQALNQEAVEDKIDFQHKKWSTFLQKPERPVVIPKKSEHEKLTAPPYKVVIKKQKRKQFATAVESTEEINVDESSSNVGTDENPEIENVENESVEENYTEETEIDDRSVHEEKLSAEEDVLSEKEDDETIAKETNIEIEAEEPPLPLEEQLAQVQQQLEALAQLPSAIQVTLEAVTKQLAKIVGVTHPHVEQDTTIEQLKIIEEETDRQEDISENLECLNSDQEDELQLDAIEETDTSEQEINCDSIEENQHEIDEEIENYMEEITNEEEEEAKRIEREKASQQERKISQAEEFHQRRLEQRPTHPLTPLQRPLILPGGRRWCQPGDAVPARRKESKMTEERISETLDTYSEIIVGHTKGINFLKYQPPPKNLDYLQRSEVYKLIHDMDPPCKGIATRTGMVVSEQDYYTEVTERSKQAQLYI